MGDTNLSFSTLFPTEPLYVGSLTTYSGPGHLGPILVKNSHILHSNQRTITQEARLTKYISANQKAGSVVYMPMRSLAPRSLPSKPLIEACPFKIHPTIYKNLTKLEDTNTACYPAHPFEAYNVECYYAASKFFTAEVSNYRHVLVSMQLGASKSATHTFKFSGVVCSLYVDRHLLLVRTTYEIYGAIIFSNTDLQVIQRKLSHYGIKDVAKLFCQTEFNIFFYPVIYYVRTDRSISRVAASRAWVDIPAVSREINLCVTHWDGTVKMFIINDDLLAAARTIVHADKNGNTICKFIYQSTTFMVAELSLPKPQPYSLTATPMGYVPVLSPEPLPLFSGIYPDRLYIAYGDMLFFLIIPINIATLINNTMLQSNKYLNNFLDISEQIKPKPTLYNVRECFCEVGDRTSFTAFQHCRNTHIIAVDADFVWIFSEKNLIEPVIRLRHSLNKTAPVRAIHTIPLVPNNIDQKSTLPIFQINETNATVETISGINVTKSIELILLMTHAQIASMVVGIDNDVSGIVFSLPYLLMQAPVQEMRLWRTPMIMKIESDTSHLRAITPHGALLGKLDIRGYNYITGLSINPKFNNVTRKLKEFCNTTSHQNSEIDNDSAVMSAMAAFAGYYPIPELIKQAKATVNDISMFVTNTNTNQECSTDKESAINTDTHMQEYASFSVELTLSFLSGEKIVIDWFAQGVKEPANLLNCPIGLPSNKQEDALILSYEGLLNFLQQQREDSIHTDPDSSMEINNKHTSPAITCVYVQNHVLNILSWIKETSSPHLQTHAHTLLSQLTKISSLQHPCIQFKHLHRILLGPHIIDNLSSTKEEEEEPCTKRLMDSNEWSEGVIKSIFPAQLFNYLDSHMKKTESDAAPEHVILPSSDTGIELINQWRESEQLNVARLFEARDNVGVISGPLLTDAPKSLPLIAPTSSDGTVGESEVHTQNIDFLVGLMKAVS